MSHITNEQFQAITRYKYGVGPRPVGVPHVAIAEIGLKQFNYITGWWRQFNDWMIWLDSGKKGKRPYIWRVVPPFAWSLRRSILATRHPDPTPIPQPPHPGPDNSLATSWLVLGQDPMDALHSPLYYKFALSADKNYRGFYTQDFLDRAHGQGRLVVPWGDCRSDGTPPNAIIEYMKVLGAPFWMGQGEYAEEFDAAMSASILPRVVVGDIAHMRDDQIQWVKDRKVLWVNELYRNCNGNPSRDWKNANAGIGGNLVAVYKEGVCNYFPISQYIADGTFIPHRDSVYGPQMTASDYASLP